MFCANRAAEFDDDVVYDTIDRFPFTREATSFPICRREGIVVNVAIADMAESAMPYPRIAGLKLRISAGDELGNARNRHGDIVLNTDPCRLLRLGEILAHLPEPGRLRPGARNQGISHEPRFHRFR